MFELLLFIQFALVFAVTFIGSILYYRSRDGYIRKFIGVLYPLAFYLLVLFLVTYLKTSLLINGAREEILGLFSLMGVFIVSALLTLAVRDAALYSLAQIQIKENLQRKVFIGLNVFCILLFLIWCFLVFYITGGDWTAALHPTLHLFYLAVSTLVFLLSLWALTVRRNITGERERKLQQRLIFSFLPLAAFIPLDLLFFRSAPFKLSFLSWSGFAVSGYLLISRYNFTDYSLGLRAAEEVREKFYLFHGISGREKELIELLLEGNPNREIAEKLCISINTVKTHIQNIYQKTGVSNRIQLLYRMKSGR